MRNIMLFTVGTLLLSGCVATQNNEVVQDDPYYAPMYPEPNMEPVVATGSLFSTQLSNDLYADKKHCEQAISLLLNYKSQPKRLKQLKQKRIKKPMPASTL